MWLILFCQCIFCLVTSKRPTVNKFLQRQRNQSAQLFHLNLLAPCDHLEVPCSEALLWLGFQSGALTLAALIHQNHCPVITGDVIIKSIVVICDWLCLLISAAVEATEPLNMMICCYRPLHLWVLLLLLPSAQRHVWLHANVLLLWLYVHGLLCILPHARCCGLQILPQLCTAYLQVSSHLKLLASANITACVSAVGQPACASLVQAGCFCSCMSPTQICEAL